MGRLTMGAGGVEKVGCCIGGIIGAVGSADGGSRTTGRPPSMTILRLRDMTEPAGDTIASRPTSRAIDERRLMAMLGE